MAKNAPDQRERAVEAVRLLGYFLMDLITGTRILGLFETPALASKITPHMGVALNRIAISHLITTLARWTEFYQRYAAILPANVRVAARDVHNRIQAQGILEFRNTVVGHILDNASKRPLTAQEVDERLDRVTGGDRAQFFRWINSSAATGFSNSVVGITEQIRDQLRVVYDLSDDEIL